MFQFYARTMLVSLLLFAVLGVAMLAIGSAQPMNPALVYFTGCEQPCWLGITPGVTTVEEAQGILESQGYSVRYTHSSIYSTNLEATPTNQNHCHVSINGFNRMSDFVRDIWLDNCTTMTVGDLMAVFGTPTSVATILDCANNGLYLTSFSFNEGVVLRDLSLVSMTDVLSPYQTIESISLFSGNESENDWWYGFLPVWGSARLTVVALDYLCF